MAHDRKSFESDLSAAWKAVTIVVGAKNPMGAIADMLGGKETEDEKAKTVDSVASECYTIEPEHGSINLYRVLDGSDTFVAGSLTKEAAKALITRLRGVTK